jgi:hypothetical protein
MPSKETYQLVFNEDIQLVLLLSKVLLGSAAYVVYENIVIDSKTNDTAMETIFKDVFGNNNESNAAANGSNMIKLTNILYNYNSETTRMTIIAKTMASR